MLIPFYWALALGVVVLTVMMTPKRSKALWASEQSAHSTAADKKLSGLEARRESRYRADRSATASVLGDAGNLSECRVLNLSRSGLRIVSNRCFPKGSQVCVQWGEEFFVGTVLYSSSDGNEHIAGLELTSGNHSWHPLERLRFWRRRETTVADL